MNSKFGIETYISQGFNSTIYVNPVLIDQGIEFTKRFEYVRLFVISTTKSENN